MDFRKTVVAIIKNNQGDILGLFCTRNNSVSGMKKDEMIWKLPQGGMDDGESSEEAIYRELKEELNLRQRDLRYISRLEWNEKFSYYFLDEENQPKFEIKLHPFLFELDFDINIKLDKSENSEYKWFSIEEFLKLDLSIRAEAYRNILYYFIC